MDVAFKQHPCFLWQVEAGELSEGVDLPKLKTISVGCCAFMEVQSIVLESE